MPLLAEFLMSTEAAVACNGCEENHDRGAANSAKVRARWNAAVGPSAVQQSGLTDRPVAGWWGK